MTHIKEIPADGVLVKNYENAVLSSVEIGRIYSTEIKKDYYRGAVYTSNGSLVVESQRLGGVSGDVIYSANSISLNKNEFEQAKKNLKGGRWLYVGSWMGGFGHFIVETIPQFYVLFTSAEKYNGICAHRFYSKNIKEWQLEFLNLLSPDLELLVVDDVPFAIESLTVCNRLYNYQHSISSLSTVAWEYLRDTIKNPGGETKFPNKIFLSRSEFDLNSKRGFENTKEVDELFKSYGYTIVYPEKETIKDQIRLASHAEIIAGFGGSALHLAAFQTRGRVLEIGDNRTPNFPNSTQAAIAHVTGNELSFFKRTCLDKENRLFDLYALSTFLQADQGG